MENVLERLRILNFRRIKRLDIILGPITVIRGATGRGKSSIVGAMRWVVANRPNNTRMINWDSKKAAVQITTSQHNVARRRSNKTNTYVVNNKLLKAFGTDVPEAAASALNMGDINFRTQHAGHFWFNLSPGNVSKQLNKIIDLGVMDRSYAYLARLLRHSTADEQTTRERVEGLQKQEDDLTYVQNMHLELVHVERLFRHGSQKQQDRLQLTEMLAGAKTYAEIAERAGERASGARIAVQQHGKYAKSAQDCEALQNLVKKARMYTKHIRRVLPNFEPLSKARTQWLETTTMHKTLIGLLGEAKALQLSIKQLEGKAKQKRKRFETAMKGRCPLCNRRTQ